MADTIIAMTAVTESEGLAGATEIEVTEEMAMEGALALADMFEYAAKGDWLTKARAAEIFRRMWRASP